MIKIFVILSEKKIKKYIIVFVAPVSFDPFELATICAPLATSTYWLQVEKNVMYPFMNLLLLGLWQNSGNQKEYAIL